MRRHRLVSRLAVVPALAALAALVVAFVPAPAPANAAGGCPVPLDRNGNCPIEKGVPVPGTSLPRHPGTTGHGPDGTSPTGTDPTPNYYCVWFPYPDQGSWRNQPIMQGAPPDAVFGEYHCFLNGLPLYGPYVPRWIAPNQVLGQAPAPPTPAEVAQAGLVKVRDLLKKPDIVTDPPDPAASIVDIPTFVSVPNWQGRLQQSNCELNVCVQLTAEPKLTFDPGETGAPVIDCEDGGTRFDPHGPDPRTQAEAAGACAYAYQLRTGVHGRPDAWSAQVTITWNVSWAGGGQTGSFDPISLSTTFDRPVDEVQSVVVGYTR